MSVQAMTRVFEQSRAKHGARLVLICLANHDAELGCFVSLERMAKECNMSLRSVQRALVELEELGELAVERAAGPHGTSRYTFVLPEQLPLDTLRQNVAAKMSPDISVPETTPELKEVGVRGRSSTSASRGGSTRTPPESPGFEEFWGVYPREGRYAKPRARKAFRAACRKASPEQIIEGAARYAADPNRDPLHTKWAQGWLSAERWNDPPLPGRGLSLAAPPNGHIDRASEINALGDRLAEAGQ